DRRVRPLRRRPLVEALERRELLSGLTGAGDEPPPNHAPVAQDDVLATNQATPLLITSESLLANDTDADGDKLRVTLVAEGGPTHGTLALSGTGSFLYQPKPDFVGSDSFHYFAWDGRAFSSAATVTINVQAVVPRLEARDDYYSTSVNTALNIA